MRNQLRGPNLQSGALAEKVRHGFDGRSSFPLWAASKDAKMQLSPSWIGESSAIVIVTSSVAPFASASSGPCRKKSMAHTLTVTHNVGHVGDR